MTSGATGAGTDATASTGTDATTSVASGATGAGVASWSYRAGIGTHGIARTSVTVAENNLAVADANSRIVLTGAYTGATGVTHGDERHHPEDASVTNWFGMLSSELAQQVLAAPFGTAATNIAAWAALFTRDTTGAKGIIATNAADAANVYLVWQVADPETFDPTQYQDASREAFFAVGPHDSGETPVPTPIGFKSIVREGELWVLTVTNGVKGCTYRLFSAETANGFGTAPDETRTVTEDGPMVFESPDGGTQKFWKAEGR